MSEGLEYYKEVKPLLEFLEKTVELLWENLSELESLNSTVRRRISEMVGEGRHNE